jgi:hypothetical protein
MTFVAMEPSTIVNFSTDLVSDLKGVTPAKMEQVLIPSVAYCYYKKRVSASVGFIIQVSDSDIGGQRDHWTQISLEYWCLL